MAISVEPPTTGWKAMLQHSLEIAVAFRHTRWLFIYAMAVFYLTRIYHIRSHWAVTYVLVAFIGRELERYFQSIVDDFSLPVQQREIEVDGRSSREFILWYWLVIILVIGCLMTFYDIFDVPISLSVRFFVCIVTRRKYIFDAIIRVVRFIRCRNSRRLQG